MGSLEDLHDRAMADVKRMAQIEDVPMGPKPPKRSPRRAFVAAIPLAPAELVTIELAAHLTGLTPPTVRHWRDSGDAPPGVFRKVRGTVFVDLPAFYAWVREAPAA